MKIHTVSSCIITLAFIVSGCFKEEDGCDPNRYCDTVPIDSNWVHVNLTEQSTGVPIVIYNGNLENNNVIMRDTLYTNTVDYFLPVEVVYTIEAYYRSGPNTIIAVDSQKLEEETFRNCGETCYENSEITLDLVLID
jgi:hypothetical protein